MSDDAKPASADASADVATAIAAHVAEALEDYEILRDGLLERIVTLRTNRLDEDRRRQMEGLTLKTTYNMHRVRALAAMVNKLREELKPLIIAVATKRALLEFAEHELEEYKAADARNVEDRRVKVEAGLYAEPAAFADRLFNDFGIDRGGYASLNDSDLKAIAGIIRRRVDQVQNPIKWLVLANRAASKARL